MLHDSSSHSPDIEGPEVPQGEPLELVYKLEKPGGCSENVMIGAWIFGLVVTCFSQCECVIMLYVSYPLQTYFCALIGAKQSKSTWS